MHKNDKSKYFNFFFLSISSLKLIFLDNLEKRHLFIKIYFVKN